MTWKLNPLGEVATIGAGNSAPQDDRFFSSDGIPFFRTSDVGRIRFGKIVESADRLNEEGRRGLRLFPKGTILFPKSGASTFLNHRVMLDVDGFVSSHLATIVADESRICADYLLYFLATIESQDLVQDHAYPSLNLPVIAGIQVPTPPLEEQHRIVALLDEAFAGIATAKANTEKSLRRAREVLELCFERAFAKGDNLRTLGTVCRFENGDRGKNYPGKEHRVTSGVPFINAGHLTNNGIDCSEMDYISRDRFSLLGNGKIRPGDILFCLRGSLGKFAAVRDLNEGAIASSLVILRPEADLSHDYLLAFLASRQCREQIEKFKGGAAQPNLGAKDLKQFELPLPSIGQQTAIVAELDALRSVLFDLQSLYTQKLAALDELKQSLLQRAFSGQL